MGGRWKDASEAERFLHNVRTAFAAEPQAHERFMHVMTSFQEGRLGTVEVMERVAVLLADRPALLAAFNTFLPEGYRVEHRAPHAQVARVRRHAQVQGGDE